MMSVNLHRHMQKNDTRPPTYTIHQNKLKMDKILKYKFDTKEVLE